MATQRKSLKKQAGKPSQHDQPTHPSTLSQAFLLTAPELPKTGDMSL